MEIQIIVYYFLSFAAFYLFAVAVAAFSANFSRMIDGWMDYGEILGFIRMRRAEKISRKNGQLNWFITSKNEVLDLPHGDWVGGMDKIYWEIASKIEPGFKSLICLVCFSTRVAIFFTLIICVAAFILVPVWTMIIPAFIFLLIVVSYNDRFIRN